MSAFSSSGSLPPAAKTLAEVCWETTSECPRTPSFSIRVALGLNFALVQIVRGIAPIWKTGPADQARYAHAVFLREAANNSRRLEGIQRSLRLSLRESRCARRQ